MRVKVKDLRHIGNYAFGEFLGLIFDERGDCQAVIRPQSTGLMLTLVHPSHVEIATKEEEEEFK